MFNPLHNDTKVAVTTTTARGNIPCVFSNYNGGIRSQESIYHHVRAESYDHDISISDAAVCTSAAPFFFKPRDVDNLDTYQDGGLQYNNPAFVASWESAFLWPDRCQILERDNGSIDHMISLGTGTAMTKKYKVGPHSPVKDRFVKRLVGSFMGQLDSEKQWNTFIHCVPQHLRSRYHRLNVLFPGAEPGLDEVRAIDWLKQEASTLMESSSKATDAKDSMIASIFYFELDSWVLTTGNKRYAYACTGTIWCRLPLPYHSRKRLYQTLIDSSAEFIVSGRAVPCVDSIPKGMPAFRRRIEFFAKDLDSEVSIFVKGITTHPTLISGMPRALEQLIIAQSMRCPFGCIDYRELEKKLPGGPLKRKYSDLN